MEIRALIFVAFVVLAGCGSSNPRTTVEELRPFPEAYRSGRRLLVVATDFRTGRLDVIPFARDLAVLNAMSVHHDTVVRSYRGGTSDFVIQRTMNSIRLLAKSDGRPTDEIALGSCNPQDVLPVGGDEIYVTCLKDNAVRRIDLSTKRQRAAVPMRPEHAESGQPPGLAQMQKLPNGNVIVAVQRLRDEYTPSTASYAVTIDPRTDAIVDSITLEKTNPVTDFKVGPDGELYLGEAGRTGFQAENDGGIERLDGRRLVARESELGGDLTDFEILDRVRGIAIVTGARKSQLVVFRPGAATAPQVRLETERYDLSQVLLDRDAGEVYVTDRTPRRPGVHVLRADTLETVRFVPMTLPPFRLVPMR